MKLLHIISTPRGDASNTLKVSAAFLEAFAGTRKDWTMDTLDLFKEELPRVTAGVAQGKYGLLAGKDPVGDVKREWEAVRRHIERFLAADAYLLSVPMWNFGIPYALKHYIDVIVQPKYLFRYTASGPEGLVKGRRMVVITSRGGDYSTDAFRKFDMQEPYLRMVFGFVGITDMRFINAQPMDAMGPDARDKKIAEARALAEKIAQDDIE